MKEFFGIIWYNSYNLIYVILLLILIIFLVFKKWFWQKKTVNILVKPTHRRVLLMNFSLKKAFFSALLIIFATCFLSLALLRPQWGIGEQLVVQEGRDLYIALDISRSMLAQDLKPNRLNFAKEKIKKLVNSLKSDRVGLIIFSSDAFVQCPLTSDIIAFFSFLDSLDVETISDSSTALDSPIKKTIDVINNSQSRKHKLLTIFTDGEDFTGDLDTIKNEAAKIGLKIFTFGVGTHEGAPIPVFDDNNIQKGYLKDKNDNIVITRLEETILKNISDKTNAMYIKAQENDNDIKNLINMIQKLEKEKFEDKRFDSYDEKYHYFVLLALFCLIFQWIL